MATVTTAYSIGDTVYHVDAITGIRKGIVKTIDIHEAYPTVSPRISYNVAYTKSTQGSVTDVEASLAVDFETAVALYAPIVESIY